jgi:hypothetical protein
MPFDNIIGAKDNSRELGVQNSKWNSADNSGDGSRMDGNLQIENGIVREAGTGDSNIRHAERG